VNLKRAAVTMFLKNFRLLVFPHSFFYFLLLQLEDVYISCICKEWRDHFYFVYKKQTIKTKYTS